MAGINVSVAPEQAKAPSPPRVAHVIMHTPDCVIEEPFAQGPGSSTHIVDNALGVPFPPTLPTQINNYGAHTRELAENVGLSKALVHDISSDVLTAPASQHKDPNFLPVFEAATPAQIRNPTPTPTPTPTTTPTPMPAPSFLTYETSNKVASGQVPSKHIVKLPTHEDENKKLASFESTKVLPCVGAFTVQCALCTKWRLIPTKEKYEEIRQSVLENPFFCSSAASWRPDVSCEDPSDIFQDESHLWAIDRPNIPVAPQGWERQLVFRTSGSSKFADIYYVAPSGRKLRSMPEVERYLAENPGYVRAGVKHSQFSFITPKPLDSNYFRKKTAGLLSFNATGSSEIQNKYHSKKPQAKKRKAFESLSCKGDLEDLDGHSKGASHDASISHQVVKGPLPTEELMKGMFWSRYGVSELTSSLGTLKPPMNVSQSGAILK